MAGESLANWRKQCVSWVLSAVGYEILFDFTILENGHHFHFTYYEEDELERLNKLLLGIFFLMKAG